MFRAAEPQDPLKDTKYQQSLSFALRSCYIVALPDFVLDLLTFFMVPPPTPSRVGEAPASPPPQAMHSGDVDASGQRVATSVNENAVEVSLHESRLILIEDVRVLLLSVLHS